MKKHYKALIFDWDGTLADSTAQIVHSVRTAFERCGLDAPNEHDCRQIIGLSLDKAMRTLAPNLDTAQYDALIRQYRAHYMSPDVKAFLFDGARELLAQWQKEYILAIATGKARIGLQRVLQDTDAAHFFTATKTADETHSKPAPDMLFALCDELGIDVQDALMIGDTTHDLDMAANAGMDAVGITTGAHSAEQLAQSPHCLILPNLNALAGCLKTGSIAANANFD